MASVEDMVFRMAAVQLMTDEEVQAVPQAYEDGEAGFGALKSERGLFPLRSIKVAAKVSSLSSHITLEQTFLNAFDAPLEATYIFPLPSRAAVTSFRLEVRDRVVEGVTKEREEARQGYTQAIAQGHRAAIAEEERSGVITIRVGNIGAGEVAAVRLTMAAPLPFTDGEATFRFPLLVAPRYIPGVKLGGTDVGSGTAEDTDMTPDASRISPPTMVTLPGFPDPVQLSIEVEFDAASLPVSNVRSSLHTVTLTDVEADGQQGATSPSVAIRRLKLDPEGDRRLNRDFILRFNVTTPSLMTASLVLSDDQGGESQEGTWQLTLIAPQGGASGGATTPRDVAFVLDRSGSMSGWKMVAARSATARVVDTLTDADRFTLLAFDNSIETPPGHSIHSLVAATDYNRQSVVNYLSKLEARGGTEMAGPLERAADALQAPRVQGSGGFWPPRGAEAAAVRDRVLVLVTDGQVGDEDWIMGELAPKLQGVRIFTLGIDQSVNEGFLTRFAALTPGGACELVESQGRLENAMDRIHRLIATPALIDVQIDGPRGSGIEPMLDATSPAKLGAVFTGIPAVVSANPEPSAGRALGARALIRELDDRYTIAAAPRYTSYGVKDSNPEKPDELRARILALSLRFSVLCRFSAFVAADRAEKVESDGAPLTQVTQPVEAPGGWKLGAMGGRGGRGGMPGAAPQASCGASRGLAKKERGSIRITRQTARPQGGLKGLSPGVVPTSAPFYTGEGMGCEESAECDAAAPYRDPVWESAISGASAGSTRGGAAAHKKAKRIGTATGASAKPLNPGDQRAAVAGCLETVRALQSPGQVADGDLLKKLVEGLREVLARVMERWQTAASFDVVRKAAKAFEAGGALDRTLLGELQAALERIEQSLGSP
ncbi:hypothetical protein KFL_002050070 [Klebsormidium nitens]|uniref:Uncharacterized protein n=1 Tax=Klebsormidium nitens TaxID=105231 RepID=A0A1Y1I1H4_KLENI|nr:hypothetical protein KFL_002050070 [Klebsormidium nitens]|eukprot:GAQ84765.1 hypothetical protein KFL_002050070 [Klebsormidium nitens]